MGKVKENHQGIKIKGTLGTPLMPTLRKPLGPLEALKGRN